MLDGSLDLQQELMEIERLQNVVKRPRFHRLYGGIAIAMRRHNNERRLRSTLASTLQKRQSIEARHANIQKRHIGLFGDQQRVRLEPGLCRYDLKSLRLQQGGQRLSGRAIIFRDKNS